MCALMLIGISVYAQDSLGCAKNVCREIPESQQDLLSPPITADGKKISHIIWQIPISLVKKVAGAKDSLEIAHPAFDNHCAWEHTKVAGTVPPKTKSVIATLTLLDGRPSKWNIAVYVK